MTGKLETELAREVKLTKVRQAILSSLSIAGILAVGMLAPNVLQLLGKIPNRSRSYNIRSVAKKLSEKGLVRYEKRSGRTFLVLTDKGRQVLKAVEHRNFSIPKPRKWDGKWRIVIFDIPEERARLRRYLSATLKRIGLYRLQDSVWIHPFDCEELITLLKTDFRVGKEVLYIIADKVENDRTLRAHFKLR